MTKKHTLGTNDQKVLDMLRQAGKEGITNLELSYVFLRYGGIMGNLYQAGYIVKKEDLGSGIWKYVLTGEPSEDSMPLPKAADALRFAMQNNQLSYEELMSLMSRLNISVKYRPNTHAQHNERQINKQKGVTIY